MYVFRIQDHDLTAELDPRDGLGFIVDSSPRPYRVDWVSEVPLTDAMQALVSAASHPLVYADRRVAELHLSDVKAVQAAPKMLVDATEKVKTIEGALELCEFLEQEGATRTSTLFVFGGGVIQDVGAFAGAMYKRGIPWVFIPTTLLAQGDSCVGGKTGLNHRSTKNLLALFSAPRRVVIHTGFLETLDNEEVLSGLGEILRLHITAGPEFLLAYEAKFKRFQAGDRMVLNEMLVSALAAKRAVVERDEFELDLRRSMNYGHSIGHAFEVLAGHRLPHGVAVTVGMLVENEISQRRGLLSALERDRLLHASASLIPPPVVELLKTLDLSGLLALLERDKKTEGKNLKLVVVEKIGQIRFIDLSLEPATVELVQDSLTSVIGAL